jgi:hypothetical protein
LSDSPTDAEADENQPSAVNCARNHTTTDESKSDRLLVIDGQLREQNESKVIGIYAETSFNPQGVSYCPDRCDVSIDLIY